jgi:hypothetical protein
MPFLFGCSLLLPVGTVNCVQTLKVTTLDAASIRVGVDGVGDAAVVVADVTEPFAAQGEGLQYKATFAAGGAPNGAVAAEFFAVQASTNGVKMEVVVLANAGIVVGETYQLVIEVLDPTDLCFAGALELNVTVVALTTTVVSDTTVTDPLDSTSGPLDATTITTTTTGGGGEECTASEQEQCGDASLCATTNATAKQCLPPGFELCPARCSIVDKTVAARGCHLFARLQLFA